MAVSASDILFKKSVIVNDTDENGGRMDTTPIQSGVKHSIFPRVSHSDRLAGITRYRKVFLKNHNALDEIAYNVLVCLEFPSTAEDYFQLALGTHTDKQNQLAEAEWKGSGSLAIQANAGSSQIQAQFEAGGLTINPQDTLYITNKYEAAVFAEGNIIPGTPVTYNNISGEWERVAFSGDYSFPKGLCVGTNLVMTIRDTTAEEWIKIDSVSWSGTLLTANLATPLVNTYPVNSSYVGICIEVLEVKPTFDSWVKTSASGLYDEVTFPPILTNRGTVYDEIVITFLSPTTFSCFGLNLGNLGNGDISSNFAPLNPETNIPYFTLSSGGFSGSWIEGDTISFKIYPASLPFWLKETVPPNSDAYTNNLFLIGWYIE